MMHRYLSSYVTLAAVAVGLSFGVAGCNEDGSNVLCMGTAYDPVTGQHTDFGATGAVAVGKKVNALLDATTAFVRASGEVDTGMLAECTAMATELGIPAAQLEPVAPPPGQKLDPGARTKAACERVATEIKTTLTANLRLDARLNVVYKPAECTVNASARLVCVQKCETMDVMQTELMCMPAKLYYPTCEGTCGIECTGSCDAECTGSCSAQCTGSCDGSCNGTCEGTCSAVDAMGKCIGKCTGKCTGSCAGKCTGGCSGTCSGGCTGKCVGGCHGSCSAPGFMPPVCEEVVVTRQETTCQDSCNAEASCSAMCTEPELTIDFAASAIIDKVKVDQVVAVLKAHYGKILRLSKRAFVITGTTYAAYKRALDGLATNVLDAGVQAGACLVYATQSAVSAFAQASVSFNVSVSVSTSVSASGTAGGMAAAGG